MERVFFYGLFMDPLLLQQQGFAPEQVQLARLDGYQLKIGARATLVANAKSCAWGTLMQLSKAQLQQLYRGDGVQDYRPINVEPHLVAGPSHGGISAQTYVLAESQLAGSNSEYAAKLAAVAHRLKLPETYVEEIATWI